MTRRKGEGGDPVRAPDGRRQAPDAGPTRDAAGADAVYGGVGGGSPDAVYGADAEPPYAGAADAAAMSLALEEARAALDHGDVPIGAVVVAGGEIVARRHNERELAGDPTAHAEVLALRDAAARLGGWRLDTATLVVTLEPCSMCAGALVAARLGRLVYGAADLKGGACGSLYNLCADPRLNHELPVTAGVMASDCAALLVEFFAERRATPL